MTSANTSNRPKEPVGHAAPIQAAKLAFLTEPSPGEFHLNLRVEGQDFFRLKISRGQLGNIVVDGARMAIHPTIVSRFTNDAK